jgi:hypothetical protein
MPTPSFPSPLTRQELEESWRLRLEAAQANYQAASTRYRTLRQDVPDGTPLEHAKTVALAREAESQALAEYRQVLHIFTDLTVRDMMPEGPWPQESSDGIWRL